MKQDWLSIISRTLLLVALGATAGSEGALRAQCMYATNGRPCPESPVDVDPPTEPSQPPRPTPVRGLHLGLSFNFSFPTRAPEAESPLPIPVVVAPSVHPELLPPGIQVAYPGFDGDGFAATLEPHAVAALDTTEAFAELVPILRAIGFERDLAELAAPAGPGTRLPPPNLAGLAEILCSAPPTNAGRGSKTLCDFLRGRPVEPGGEAAFRRGGGLGLRELRQALERPVYQYSFPQRVGDVPIEASGLLAYRREGESLSWVHGTVFNRYQVANRPALTPAEALGRARDELAAAGPADVRVDPGSVELVLLPTGAAKRGAEKGSPALRYAYRALLHAGGPGNQAGDDAGNDQDEAAGTTWLVRIDAENGKLLELLPQQDEAGEPGPVRVTAPIWPRDPTTAVSPVEVELDPPAGGGPLRLQLGTAFRRLDRRGGDDLVVPAAPGPQALSSYTLGAAQALCAAGPSGGDTAFRQINAYAHLYRAWKLTVDAGTIPRFPVKPATVQIDVASTAGNNADYDHFGTGQSRLRFILGNGFDGEDCPNTENRRGNAALDATILTHELAHLSTKRLHDRRPKDWCAAKGTCPLPCGRALFHDFADAMANAYAGTNCFAGWTDKNRGGVDASLGCRDGHHDESWGFPRLAAVADVLDPSSPGDHFPERRRKSYKTGEREYADGQIAAAALWRTREGLRSLSALAGALEERVLLNRALWSYGFLSRTCQGCDRDLYRYLQDLLRQTVAVWGSPATTPQPDRTTHKVLSGFARAGIFLVPSACIDGNPKTADPAACPSGEDGGDAVIDIDDNDPADDPVIDGVRHPEVDYLERSGPPPTFRVWTGPRFVLDKNGSASTTGARGCNVTFEVEVGTTPDLAGALRSGRLATHALPGCYGEWTPDESGWRALVAKAGEIHYRARTWDAAGGDEKTSISPGGGLFTLPPAVAIVNDTGRP